MSVTLSPEPFLQFMNPNNSGSPAAGFKLFTYIGGTSTKQATWTDSTQTVQNSNPIVLDANGAAQVWGDPNLTYKYILASPNDSDPPTSPLRSTDNFQFPITVNSGISVLAYPITQAEISAGVEPINRAFQPGTPERYIATFVYASDTTGTTGTDFSAAINIALSIFGGPDNQYQPVILGPHLYTIGSKLIVPAGQTFAGAGCNAGGLCCTPGFNGGIATSGPVITDNGSAAHLTITGIAIYGNHAAGITAGIQLGKTIAFGTNGTLDQIYVTSIPTESIAIDCTCNIVEMGALYTTSLAGSFDGSGCRFLGTGIHIRTLSIVACSGFPDENSNNTCLLMSDGTIDFYECEAPSSNVFIASINGLASFKYVVASLASDTTFAQLIDISGNAPTWDVNLGAVYYSNVSGHNAIFTNAFYDRSAGIFFGGGNLSNTTTNKGMVGHYQSELFLQSQPFAIKKQTLNAFTLRVTNPSGTIQHRIGTCGSSGVATNFATSINAASNTLQNTPTGTDASTAFAFGGKISSASPSVFILDTGAEIPADSLLIATVSANSTTTAYGITAVMTSFNVNGVTQSRLTLQLLNPTTGAAVTWSTALTAGGGVLIDVTVFGYFK